MPKLLIKTIGLMLIVSTLMPQAALAGPKGQKVGSSKASPYNKTRDQAKGLHQSAIKNQAKKVQTLNARLNDFADFMVVSKELRKDKAALAQVRKAINEHHDAKVALGKLTQTSYANFAAARGYRIIPNPPTAAPPPLPPKQLTVTFKETRKDPKSKRPPGMPPRKPRSDKY